MPTILLIRHGQGSFGTADYDVLSALGVEQSNDTFAHYGPHSGEDSVVLTAGGLRRQRDTAVPWGTDGGREVSVDERWDEYDSDHILDTYADKQVSLDVADGREQLPPKEFQTALDGALTRWIADPQSRGRAFAGRSGLTLLSFNSHEHLPAQRVTFR